MATLQYPCLENPMDRGAWWVIVGYSPGGCKKSDTDEHESGTHTVHLKEFSSEPQRSPGWVGLRVVAGRGFQTLR